jgi:circadian clock protein KaiB
VTKSGGAKWSLTLYVSGASPRSAEAIEAVRRICDDELADQVELTIVDVTEQPALALADNVVAVPTLIKRLPGPLRQLVGNLADAERVRAGLDLGAARADRPAPAPAPHAEGG